MPSKAANGENPPQAFLFSQTSVFHLIVSFDGDIAQLVERLNGIEKVRGSTPLISTNINLNLDIRKFGIFYFTVFKIERTLFGGRCSYSCNF